MSIQALGAKIEACSLALAKPGSSDEELAKQARAVFVYAKRVHFSETNYAEMGSLLSLIQTAKLANQSHAKWPFKNRFVQVLNILSAKIDQEKQLWGKMGLLLQVKGLTEATRAQKMAVLDPLFAVLKQQALLQDPEFAFEMLCLLIQYAPEYLTLHLDLFPLQEEHLLLQLGSLIENNALRKAFATHFKVSENDLIIVHKHRLHVEKDLPAKFLDLNGLCFGFVLALASERLLHPNRVPNTEELFSQARFIQNSYVRAFSESLTRHAPQMLGQTILSDPHAKERYPLTLSRTAAILGYSSIQKLIEDSNPTHLLRNETMIGRIALSLMEHTANNSLPKEKQPSLKELNALDSIVPLPNSDLINRALNTPPAPVMKALSLVEKEISPDVNSLSHLLRENQDKSGVFALTLFSEDTGSHALYLSFDPPAFCDIFDVDLITKEVQFRRQFKTADEMIFALRKWIGFKYGLNYSTFSLTRYEKTQ
jgi:hypothetical protein